MTLAPGSWLQIHANLSDRAVTDCDVGARKVTAVRIHRYGVAVLYQQILFTHVTIPFLVLRRA
jgi:hypothetical protein